MTKRQFAKEFKKLACRYLKANPDSGVWLIECSYYIKSADENSSITFRTDKKDVEIKL